MDEMLIGLRVERNGVLGTIIDHQESPTSNIIVVEWDNGGHTSRFQYPHIFLNEKWGVNIQNCGAKLKRYLSEEQKHFCFVCKQYSKEIKRFGSKSLCKDCAKRTRLLPCCSCGEYFPDCESGFDNKLYCKECFDARFPAMHKDLSNPRTAPLLYIRSLLPSSCLNNHKMYNVKAKVVVRKDGRYSKEYINIPYCEDCKQYCTTAESFRAY